MEHQGQLDFDPEKFDFCIHRKKRNNAHRVKQQEITPEPTKKIKTLLPKTKTLSTHENTLLSVSTPDTPPAVSTPTTSIADSGKIFV